MASELTALGTTLQQHALQLCLVQHKVGCVCWVQMNILMFISQTSVNAE